VQIHNVRITADIDMIKESVEKGKCTHTRGGRKKCGSKKKCRENIDHGIWNTGHKQLDSNRKQANLKCG